MASMTGLRAGPVFISRRERWAVLLAAACSTSILLAASALFADDGMHAAAAACDALRWLLAAWVAWLLLARHARRAMACTLALALPAYACAGVQMEARGPAHYHPTASASHHHASVRHHHHSVQENVVDVGGPERQASELADRDGKPGIALDFLPVEGFAGLPSSHTPIPSEFCIARLPEVLRSLERPPRSAPAHT